MRHFSSPHAVLHAEPHIDLYRFNCLFQAGINLIKQLNSYLCAAYLVAQEVGKTRGSVERRYRPRLIGAAPRRRPLGLHGLRPISNKFTTHTLPREHILQFGAQTCSARRPPPAWVFAMVARRRWRTAASPPAAARTCFPLSYYPTS